MNPAILKRSMVLGLLFWSLQSSSLWWAGAETLDSMRLYNQGIEYYGKGNMPQAVELFEKAVKVDPKYADAYYNLGSIYYQTNAFEKAQRAFKRVVELSPNDTQAKYNLALSLQKTGRPSEAIQILRQIPPSDRKYDKALERMSEWQKDVKIAAAKAAVKAAPKVEVAKKPATQPTTESKAKTTTSKATTETSKKPTSDAKRPVETFASGFFGPTGMSMAGDGTLYVANYSKNSIYKVTPQGEKLLFVKDDGLYGPMGMVLDARNGALYVANYLQNNVVKVSPRGTVSIVASGLNKPYNLLLDSVKNVLYVSEQETNAVSKILLPK